jgi:Glyoxalase-like domain
VTIDCLDPERVAQFWSILLQRQPGPSESGWVYLGERGDPQPRLVFQPVPESKAGKVRIHLDVAVDDIDEGIDLVTSLGGHFTGERHDYEAGAVVVMTDDGPAARRNRSGPKLDRTPGPVCWSNLYHLSFGGDALRRDNYLGPELGDREPLTLLLLFPDGLPDNQSPLFVVPKRQARRRRRGPGMTVGCAAPGPRFFAWVAHRSGVTSTLKSAHSSRLDKDPNPLKLSSSVLG